MIRGSVYGVSVHCHRIMRITDVTVALGYVHLSVYLSTKGHCDPEIPLSTRCPNSVISYTCMKRIHPYTLPPFQMAV